MAIDENEFSSSARPDPSDPPVHHVARRDHVRTRLRVEDGHLGEHLQRRVVVDLGRAVLSLMQNSAVPVIGILVDTYVGHHNEIGRGALHLRHGPRHGPVGVEPARTARIFGLRQTEQNHPAEAAPRCILRRRGGCLHRQLRDPGHRRDRARRVDGSVKEERQDEIAGRQPRLADEREQARCGAQAAGAGDRERHDGVGAGIARGLPRKWGVALPPAPPAGHRGDRAWAPRSRSRPVFLAPPENDGPRHRLVRGPRARRPRPAHRAGGGSARARRLRLPR